MCQPEVCVQQLQAANFVSHELKTDAVYWLHTTLCGFAKAASRVFKFAGSVQPLLQNHLLAAANYELKIIVK